MVQTRMAKPGFSLIEIMIALMIIGVMMGGTLGLMSWVGRAKRTSTEAALRGIKSAIMVYHDDVGMYPPTLKDLSERPVDPKASPKWKGPYLDKEVTLDGFKHEYQYFVNAPKSAQPFELYSWGKEGEGAPEEDWISVWKL